MKDIIEKLFSDEISWEEAIFVIGSIYIFKVFDWALKDTYNRIKKSKSPNSHDEDAWKKYRKCFDDMQGFLKSHDFGNSFDNNTFSKFGEIMTSDTFKEPDYQFYNRKLKRKQKILLRAFKKFMSTLATNTFHPLGNNDVVCVPNDDDTKCGSELRSQKVKELNSAATELFKAYEKLNEQANKIFNKKILNTD